MTNKFASATDRDRRASNAYTRGRDLYWTISIGMISNLVTLAIISSIDDTPALAISAVLIATLVFVLVSSFDCMDDLKAIASDMDDEESSTKLGAKLLGAPWYLFKGLLVISFGAMAVTQLLEIW